MKKKQKQQSQVSTNMALLVFLLAASGVSALFVQVDFWRGVAVGVGFVCAVGLGMLYAEERKTTR